jgi:hypothetical protein
LPAIYRLHVFDNDLILQKYFDFIFLFSGFGIIAISAEYHNWCSFCYPLSAFNALHKRFGGFFAKSA